MGIDHNKRLKEHLYYYSARISRDMSNLIKWLVLAVFYVEGSDQLPEGA